MWLKKLLHVISICQAIEERYQDLAQPNVSHTLNYCLYVEHSSLAYLQHCIKIYFTLYSLKRIPVRSQGELHIFEICHPILGENSSRGLNPVICLGGMKLLPTAALGSFSKKFCKILGSEAKMSLCQPLSCDAQGAPFRNQSNP